MIDLDEHEKQGGQAYNYTVLAAKDKPNPTRGQKNILVIGNGSTSPNHQELIEENNSLYPMRPPSSHQAIKADEVELPKVNLLFEQFIGKKRKESAVVIDLPNLYEEEGEEEQSSNANHINTQGYDSDSLGSIEEQKNESGGWNINNLKVLPSKNNNYVESDYVVMPQLASEKQKKKRKSSRNLEREMERRERERNMALVSNFLSGKASMVWLFVLGPSIREDEIEEVRAIYSEYTEYDYEVPICRSYEEACKFFNLQNCFFKVVVDLELSQHFLEENDANKNVASIYIFNPRKIEGINRAFQMKKNLKKIKGMYTSLKEVTRQAQDDIENEAKFVKIGDDIEREKNKLRFPSFIPLTGADSTDVTNYRLCLFGALKLKEARQKEIYLKEFTEMVELRYKGVEKELRNLKEYEKIDHLGENVEKKCREVLQFYVRETFYYVLTNSILRLSRNSEEFRPCTIPFNETYHAINHFYQQTRKQDGKAVKKMVVYRGAKLRNSDIKAIEIGAYIELLGFTSTSLNRSEAEKFMDGDSYLFEIHIEEGAQKQSENIFDHGYVDINKYSLASKAFQKEEEVLINALNVFKVTGVDFVSATRKITLRYGAILPLLRAQSNELTSKDKAAIENYKYCLQTFEEIQDDGDVLLIAQEHDRCVEYYQNRVQKGEANFKVLGKLAHAQLESGDIDEAYSNALKSLENLELSSENNQEVQQKVSQLKQSAQIFQRSEDLVHGRNSLDMCLIMLKDDWLQTARVLKEKADRSLKAGDLGTCQKEVERAKLILDEKAGYFTLRKQQIQKRYRIRSLCCGCTHVSATEIQQQKEFELIKLEEQEIEYEIKKDEIHELYIEVLSIYKELAEAKNDKHMYQKSVDLGQQHFADLGRTTLNPIQEAKMEVLSAQVVDKHENMLGYEQKMEAAIALVKKQDPFHQRIGVYNNVLGTERQMSIKRKMQLSPIEKHPMEGSNLLHRDYVQMSEEGRPAPSDKFNYEECENMTKKCKRAFIDAAENIAYNSGKESPDYLAVRNKMSQLELDGSQMQESERLLKETRQFKLVNFHSQGARCYLLLTKISLAKGQLKDGFTSIEQAFTILRTTLLKADTKEYNSILVNNPLYIEIKLNRAKIFNRQLKHDLALKELTLLRKVAEIRKETYQNSSLLAMVFEEEAQVKLCSGETEAFEENILNAIDIREGEMGRFNIPNAVSYSNLFKFMLNLNDEATALKYHLQAAQIFSRFPSDHPNFWVIFLSNALLFFRQQQFDKCVTELQNCQKVISFRYNPNHIIALKVDYQHATMLRSMNKVGPSIEIFKDIERVIVDVLRQKRAAGELMQKEADDEKFPLLRKVYGDMKGIHQQMGRESSERELTSTQQVEKYSKKLKDIQQFMVVSSNEPIIQLIPDRSLIPDSS